MDSFNKKGNKPEINHDDIYTYLFQENWELLIDIFHNNQDLINSDVQLTHSLEMVLTVVTNKAKELNSDIGFIKNIERIISLDLMKKINLKTEQKEAIVVAYISAKKEDLNYVYNYAKDYPNNKICKEIIKEFEKKSPKLTQHSQSNLVKVLENNDINERNDFRKSLFKSPQETEFYFALKRVFDTYLVYPNIAISSILDFESIKDELDSLEKKFFFETSIDFAVFEPFKNYIPIHFFEIDSEYHDSVEQKTKDSIKDKIFSISGQKLYRIRKINKKIDEIEFEKLVIEIRDKIVVN